MRELHQLSDRELLIYTAAGMERIDKIVFGNGQPGLVTRMARAEEAAESLEKSISALQPPSRTTERVKAGGALSGVVALVLYLLPEFMKAMPR
jgi:hypothetical protein